VGLTAPIGRERGRYTVGEMREKVDEEEDDGD
jgi:hypothetical protein